ncbi:glycosyltransferase family 4 protein [Paraburkholderia sediminicola]|uniref:glycosyltransferase family 4 protein n=1 Tax=Paraburkholderia sediminicola TaxID=458836 RepID=UPI0038BBE922
MKNNAGIKVLMVGRDVNGTGGGRVLVETALGLARRGCDVVVLSDTSIPELSGTIPVMNTWFGDALKVWQTKHKVFRVIRHTLQILCFTGFGTAVAVNFRKRGYVIVNHNVEVMLGDVIVLHNVFSAQAIMESKSKFWRQFRLLNPVFAVRIIRERWVLGHGESGAVVAVSRPTMEEAMGLIKGNRKKVVIQNGVDTVRFSKGPDVPDVHVDRGDEEIPLLFVGHEFERKGLRYLIEALQYLPERVVLLVAGGRGSNADEYVGYAHSVNVSDRVRFLGTVRNTGDLYRRCFAFVLPTSYEALPLVVLEAMACAKPVLATAVGGIVDILDDGRNGFVIERDAKDIAKKVALLIASPDVRREISAAAARTADEHTWDCVSEKYFEVIASIAGEKDRRGVVTV